MRYTAARGAAAAVIAAASIGLLAGTAGATTTTHPTMTYRQQSTGQGLHGKLYNIYTENGGKLSDTLQLTKVGAAFVPAFKVLRASSGGWIYPNIGAGAERGMRPPNTWNPVQINGGQGKITTSVSTTLKWSNWNWNAGYDIWLTTRYDLYGNTQCHGGTEIMIWTAASRNGHAITRGPGANKGSVLIDGILWNVNDGLVSNRSCGTWHRIYYVAQHPRSGVSNMYVNPFLSDAWRRKMAGGSYYLSGIEYGFEIDKGGAGLSVNNFSVTGVR